jgi:hypothetical protein
MNNDDLAFTKWLLISKGGKRGQKIADGIKLEAKKPEPKKKLVYVRPLDRARTSTKPYRTKPDHQPVQKKS